MGQINIILGCLSFVIVVVWGDELAWNTFQVNNKKLYKTKIEADLREKIFNENLQTIEEHNKKYEQGLVSYKLGINKFADLSDDEFHEMLNSQEVDGNELKSFGNAESFSISSDQLPASIDWRERNAVTPVKHQGQCGSCWAFLAIASIESAVAMRTGKMVSLSEQQLVDCDRRWNNGCGGGTPQRAIDYITSTGISLEEHYPYKAVQETCNQERIKPYVRTRGYVSISRNNETQLKQAVGLVGPVAVALYATPIKLYESGIFDGECDDVVDHGALAVGYGIESATGVQYWIMKNSWGTEWGEKGYFKIKMGSNLCRLAQQACYAVLPSDSGPDSASDIRIVPLLYLGVFLFLYLHY